MLEPSGLLPRGLCRVECCALLHAPIARRSLSLGKNGDVHVLCSFDVFQTEFKAACIY